MAHKDAVHLVACGSEADLVVPEGQTLFVGRGNAGIRSAGVSRQHCELWWKQHPKINVKAVKKRVFISRCPGDLVTVEPGSSNTLEPGDTLYLLHPATHSDCAFKWPLPPPGTSPIATARRNVSLHHGHESELGSKVAAKRKRHAALVQQADAPGLFSGCEAFFAARLHLAVMMSRFQAEGGVITDTLTPRTTHVVVSSKTEPAARTADRLASAVTALCKPAAGTSEDDRSSLAAAKDAARQAAERLRNHTAFITATWISSSLASATRLPESEFAEPAASDLLDKVVGPAAEAAAAAAKVAVGADSGAHADADRATPARHAAAPGDTSPHNDTIVSGAPAPTANVPELDVALTACSNADGAAVQAARDKAAGSDGLHPAGTGLTDWQPAGWTAADWGVEGVWLEPFALSSVQDTLGQLFRHYHRLDLQSPARQDRPPSASQSPVSPAVLGGHATGEAPAPASPLRSSARAGAAPACGHAACAHAAVCIVAELEKTTQSYIKGRGADTFRLFATKRAIGTLQTLAQPLAADEDVDRLHLGAKSTEKVKDVLHDGFLMRNAQHDVDDVAQATERFGKVWGVGPGQAAQWAAQGFRTTDEVLRNEGIAATLTKQARAGMTHHKDLCQRLPREETFAGAQLVGAAAAEKIAELCGCSLVDAKNGLHARGMGSFCRGADTTGDCDCMVIPGDAFHELCPRRLLAAMMAKLHDDGVATTDVDLPQHTSSCACSSQRSATYCGICYIPGFSGLARRLDIKVYRSHLRITAINYFTGSQLFNRALRYWCARPPPHVQALAAKHFPGANRFKLSDKAFFARCGTEEAVENLAQADASSGSEPDTSKQGRSHKRKRHGRATTSTNEVALCEQAVTVWCESDVFKAIGLAYVPPFMRYFYNPSM